MADFPSIANPSEFVQTYRKGQIKGRFEDGTVFSRAKETRARFKFTLSWKSLSGTDYIALITFFNSNIGTTFTYTHPLTSTEYTVRFAQDELPKARNVGFMGVYDTGWEIMGLELEED